MDASGLIKRRDVRLVVVSVVIGAGLLWWFLPIHGPANAEAGWTGIDASQIGSVPSGSWEPGIPTINHDGNPEQIELPPGKYTVYFGGVRSDTPPDGQYNVTVVAGYHTMVVPSDRFGGGPCDHNAGDFSGNSFEFFNLECGLSD